jgi:hypothetical protein
MPYVYPPTGKLCSLSLVKPGVVFSEEINAEQVGTVNKHVLLERSKRKSVDYV